IDLHEQADADVTVSIDGSQGAPVADGISDDERIRSAMQEGDVEWRPALRVLELTSAKRAVMLHREYDNSVGVWRVRSDHSICSVRLWYPENGRAIRVQTCASNRPI